MPYNGAVIKREVRNLEYDILHPKTVAFCHYYLWENIGEELALCVLMNIFNKENDLKIFHGHQRFRKSDSARVTFNYWKDIALNVLLYLSLRHFWLFPTELLKEKISTHNLLM